MTISFSQQDVNAMLETPIGEFQYRRQLCKQCGFPNSHAMIHCPKCGGEFVDVSNWSIFNVLQRIKPHQGRYKTEEDWLPAMMAYQLEKKYKKDDVSYFAAYRFFIQDDNLKQLKEFYRNYKKEKGEF